ncbi:hypothetical protein RRG08_040753 [Elysia crispata]|uniref:Uncharacterized protein n=1 Tax=Elysia crispata TaxID=231223 RepID=A0AAE1BFS6_9GAST|nr:hypothetical protein RRG08_040753 [Elysia crispata]
MRPFDVLPIPSSTQIISVSGPEDGVTSRSVFTRVPSLPGSNNLPTAVAHCHDKEVLIKYMIRKEGLRSVTRRPSHPEPPAHLRRCAITSIRLVAVFSFRRPGARFVIQACAVYRSMVRLFPTPHTQLIGCRYSM